jgi:GntR family transcriptional regulator, transcriptional repressor for pyruvate dehydrogenase complex
MAEPAGPDRGVVRHRAADQIFDAVRAEIVAGGMPRGARLPTERDLASRYGVSVPTVREAIRALAATGLVDVRHGSGSFVTADPDRLLALHLVTFLQLEDVELQDAVGLLRVLDRQAVLLASAAATEGDVAALRAAVDAIDAAETVADVGGAVTHFLGTVAAASHDRLLGAMARFLIDLVVRLEMDSYGDRSPAFWRQWVHQLQPYRRTLVEAVARRDRAAAGEAADEYHRAVARQVAENPLLRGVRFSDSAVVALLAQPRPVGGAGTSDAAAEPA